MSPSIFLSEEIDQKVIIFKSTPYPKISTTVFLGQYSRNPYTLVVHTMYAKRVLGTTLSVRFHLRPKCGDAGKTRSIKAKTRTIAKKQIRPQLSRYCIDDFDLLHRFRLIVTKKLNSDHPVHVGGLFFHFAQTEM